MMIDVLYVLLCQGSAEYSNIVQLKRGFLLPTLSSQEHMSTLSTPVYII